MVTRRGLMAAALAGAALTSSPTMAQEAEAQPQPTPSTPVADPQHAPQAPKTLTGDWGGLRTRLKDGGLDLTAGYVSEFGANVSGGQKHDATIVGQFTFGAKVDTQKAFGLEGGTINASITYRHGHLLDQRAGLGLLQQSQEVYGRGQTWRLTELWYRQVLGDGTDIRAGRMVVSNDFTSFSCDFMNLTFCGSPAGNLAGDYWYNSPVSEWGARFRIRKPRWFFQVGAYANNPNDLNNDFAISHGGKTGLLAPVEFGWTPRIGRKGLPGSYRATAWYNTVNGNDVLTGVDRQPFAVTGLDPLRRSGRWGFTFLAQQQLTGSFREDPDKGPVATHGLSVFVHMTQVDRKTEKTDNQITGGLFYVGAIPGRPKDDLGFAMGRTNYNGRAAETLLLETPGSERPQAEYAAELFYGLHLRDWLIVRPNAQYVINPGGFKNATDVVVLGIKSAVTF